ncbi:ATP-binding protein [Azonexus caeni]|jgi:signal transduction histidine kinase|uniref:ATP-binding protein n=1 Tax=Azonexus caeni TaxID=266126 RepID=UPI003A8A308A
MLATTHSVAIRLEASEDALHLSIADDGRGLAEDALPRGRGLRNMQVRAQRLGGEVVQVNGDGGGCRIALRVPLTAPVA